MWYRSARGSRTSPVRWNGIIKEERQKTQVWSLNCEKKRKIDFQEIQCFHLLSEYSGGGDVCVCVRDSVNGTIKQAHDCITEDFDDALSLLRWSAE